MRKFIRHPGCVPVEIAVDDRVQASTTRDVSAGGLAFRLLHPLHLGARVAVRMPQIWPDYSALGEVVWCRETQQGYEAGVQFPDPSEAFRARMLEQFCQIEAFRQELHQHQGRQLSSEEAAREWVVLHGADFARTFSQPQP